ncbi:MAG: hypothetical protein ACTTI3_07170 [Treponema sp.]
MENNQTLVAYPLFEQRTIEGVSRLCINSGHTPRQAAHARLLQFLHEKGCRITAQHEVSTFILNEPIVLTEPTTQKEHLYFILPFQHIQTLGALVVHTPDYTGDVAQECSARETVVQLLLSVFSQALAACSRHVFSPEFLHHAAAAGPLCFFTTSEHELIILPPRLFLCCMQAHSTVIQTEWHTAWAHPSGSSAPPYAPPLFLLSALIYTCLTGMHPFNSDQAFAHSMHAAPRTEERHPAPPLPPQEQLIQHMHDAAFVPIELFCPTLHRTFAAAVNTGLTLTASDSAQQTISCLCSYHDQPIFAAGQRCEPHTNHIKRFIARQKRKRSVQRLWKKQGHKIRVVCLCMTILAIGMLLAVQNKTTPLAHLSDDAVVTQFYQAIAQLEHYTQKQVHTDYDHLVMHLFIAGTVREGYERKKIYYTPEECMQVLHAYCTRVHPQSIAEPTLEQLLQGGLIYGISHFAVQRRTAASAEQSAFEVSFYYWLPLFPQEQEAADDMQRHIPLQIYFYRDNVQLVHTHDRWRIASVEPVERSALVTSAEAFLHTLFLPPEQKPFYLHDPVQFYRNTEHSR